MICRVCGNAGHIGRDCPDRQRGQNWRNDDRGGIASRPTTGRISQGDAVDREYESLMQELSGAAPAGAGPQQRIEAGPGGYDNAEGNNYGSENRDLKPWQRGPTGAAAPWQQRGRDDRDGGAVSGPPPWAAGGRSADNYGYAGAGAGAGAGVTLPGGLGEGALESLGGAGPNPILESAPHNPSCNISFICASCASSFCFLSIS